MTDTASIVAQLTGPGGPFEIAVEDVVGVPTQVYKQRMRSMRELMQQNAFRPDVPWLVQGDRRYTFGQHDAAARVVAHRLSELGVDRGDRVALVSANNPEWVLTFWACAILGAVLVPLNAWWKTEELEFGLQDSGAKVLIADERRLALIRPRLPELRELEHVFVIGSGSGAGGDAGDGVVQPFDDLMPGAAGDDAPMPDDEIDEDDLLAILYTSGTTGQPKGATVSQRQ